MNHNFAYVQATEPVLSSSPWRVVGWVGFGGWLHTRIVYL